jgi:hypothetical protein
MVTSMGTLRRVKRFFGDAHVPGPVRSGWPVVLVDGGIAWIPGVAGAQPATLQRPRRSEAAFVVYHCERRS